MREYARQKTELKKIICNQCGREIKMQKGIVGEGVFSGDVTWGYFSGKDGQRHSFDLCEQCYDRLIQGFAIKPLVEEEKELI